MTLSKAGIAEEVSHTLSEPVSQLIFAQGEEKIRALQIASHALDSRCTQVATLQFAATAFAAAAVTKNMSWSGAVAAGATMIFVWGGITPFRGIRSDPIRLPGIEPAWWVSALEHPNFSLNDARAWAAKVIQESIEQVEGENEIRARNLDASLRLAVIGAVLIALAAGVRMIPGGV